MPKNPFDFVKNSSNREEYVPSSTDEGNPFDFVKNSKSVILNTPTTDPGITHEDTQYNNGYLSTYDNLERFKARQQPWIDQLGNSVAKAIPGTALKILENAGDLGELVFDHDDDKEYSNIFTQIAQEGQKKLNDTFHTYQETPSNEFASPKDSGWWFNLGDGLVQSVGAFWATGAGVGGTLSKAAKGLNMAISGGEVGGKVLQGAAQLSTAGALSYTEGVQSGAQVYQATKEQKMSEGLSEEDAKKIASEAASKTVQLNTIINTGLNITSLSPVFKSFGHLDDGVRQQLSRKVKESLPQYIERLGALENQGVKQASIMKTLAGEALQEGVEEDVNIFAENEGYLKGGVESQIRSNKPGMIDRFIDTMFSQEGAVNFLSGAVGGIAQTAGLEYAPIRKDAEGNVTSARNLETKDQQKYQKETISTFKNDLVYLQDKQKALNEAVASKDENKIEQARQDLFNVAALKSIRNETTDALAQEISKIAQVDNTKIGQDQLTDAQRQGLADNIDDNAYKQKAIKKAGDLKLLNKEYRNLQSNNVFSSPYALNEAFRARMDVYSTQSVLDDLHIKTAEAEADLSKIIPDPQVFANSRLNAELMASSLAIKELESRKIPVPQQVLDAHKVLEETYKLQDKTKGVNTSAATSLVKPYANKIFTQAVLANRQETYNDILRQPKEFEKQINKEVEKAIKIQERLAKEKADQESKAKQQTDVQEAKAKEAVKEEEKTKEPEPIITPESPQSILINKIRKADTEKDLDAYLDEADKANITSPEIVDAISKKREEINSTKPVATNQIQTINPVDNSYQGKTTKEVAEEEAALFDIVSSINEENNATYGYHNKIAYKAQEQDKDNLTADPSVINDRYKDVHSSKFGEGSPITLAIVTGTFEAPQKGDPKEYQDAIDKDIYEVPIGVFHEGKLIGYLPVYKNQNKDLLIVRNLIVKGGKEVTTKVSKKTIGNLNKSTKHSVTEAFPIIPKFVIGQDGTFNDGYQVPYKGDLVNSSSAKTGFVYAVTTTPVAGKEIATPVDVNKLTEEVANSVLAALNIYLSPDQLTEADQKVLSEVFDKYGIDLTTKKGLQEYVDLFVYSTDLGNPDNVLLLDNGPKDRFYIQVSPNGMRFMESGRAITDKKTGLKAPYEVGKNTPNPEKFYPELKKHLLNSYFKIDIQKLTSKQPFEAPLLSTEAGVKLTPYNKETYAHHIADNTTTNLVGVRLSQTEQTILVQPSIFIDYSFLTEKEVLLKTDKNNQEKVAILATNKENISGVAKNPNRRKAPQNITQQDAESLKDNCNNLN